MTAIKEYAEELVALIREKLVNNEHFDNVWYEIVSSNKMNVVFSVKPLNGFRFTDCEVCYGNSSNVMDDADAIVKEVSKRMTQEAIEGFAEFIRDIRKWGTN